VKAFLPPLDSVWRLKADFQLTKSFVQTYDNEEFVGNLDVNTRFSTWPTYANHTGQWVWTDELRAEHDKWITDQITDKAVIPVDSVVVFDRYHVSHSGENQITLRLLGSPDPRLRNKKNGGTGKGKMRFYVHLDDLNTFPELEAVDAA
jgi:hypothetical protein